MASRLGIDEVEQAMRRQLAIQHEDEEALSFLFKRTRDQTKGAVQRGGASPWRIPADFSVPCPGGGRPKSWLGSTSFHFDLSYSSRTILGSKVVSSTKTRFVDGDAASDQHHYIQKHALHCETAMFAAYMRLLPDKLELLPETLIEAEGAATRTIWRSPDGAYLNNIHRDPEVVNTYWPAVHRSERKAGLSKLRLKWGALSTSQWRDILERDDIPPDARHLLHAAATAAGAGTGITWPQTLLLRDGVRLDEEVCLEVLNLVEDATSAEDAGRAVAITNGRGGRTQYRLVAELPAELDDIERILIVKEFCESLNALGVMFEAVIHAPDFDNDARNYHMHIIYHDRPVDYLAEHGRWDFEVRQPVPGRPGRLRPLRRKVDLGARPGMTRKEAGAAFLKALRELWAEINNAALVRAGKYPRYDPRTYAEMGIDQEPAEHLDNSAARASLAGVPSAACIRNAERYWTAEWKRRDRRIQESRKHWHRLAGHAGDYIEDYPDVAAARDLKKLLEQFVVASTELDRLERRLLLVDLYEEMLRSRALKTKAAAVRLVRAIERGDATATVGRYGPDIAERGLEAFDWLRRMDRMAAPLAEIRCRRDELRALVRSAARQLEPLVPDEMMIDIYRERAESDLPPEAASSKRERLLAMIKAEDLPIMPDRDGKLSPRGVIGLDPADAAFLETCFVVPFLRKRFEFQEREIGRLRAYRRKRPDVMYAVLVGAESVEGAPKAIRTLLGRYRGHPEIRRWESDAIDEAARLEEEADEQLQRQEAAAEQARLSAEAAAAAFAGERNRIESFLKKAEVQGWEVFCRDCRYFVAQGHNELVGIADLLDSIAHAERVQERYAALAREQGETRWRVLSAIAALKKVGFARDGSIVPLELSPELQPLFETARVWRGVPEALQNRARAIEEEVMKEIEPLLRKSFIRISIEVNAVCSVPRGCLDDEHEQFLDRHEKRPLVQEKLLALGREHRRLYNELKSKIFESSPAPATEKGELDFSRLPAHLRGPAEAWRGEKGIEQALKGMLDSESRIAARAMTRIEQEGLRLVRTTSGWSFDERLSAVERSCLASRFHAATIDAHLQAISARREREAEAERVRLRQVAEEQRRTAEAAAAERRRAAEAAADERRRVNALIDQIEERNLAFDLSAVDWNLDPRFAAADRSLLRGPAHLDYAKTRLTQIARERHRLNEAAKQRRLEADAEQRREQLRVAELLNRIHHGGLLFERAEAGGWRLDLKLTAEERALLRSPVYSGIVDKRLPEIAEEREDIRKDDERRLAEERAQLTKVLNRIEREGLTFDLRVPDWALDYRILERERRLLGSKFYRSVVEQRLQKILALRRSQAASNPVPDDPLRRAELGSSVREMAPDLPCDDDLAFLAAAWRSRGKDIG